MTAIRPIFPLMRTLPACRHGASIERHAMVEGTTFLAPATLATADLVQRCAAPVDDDWPRHWTFTHNRTGAPFIASDRDRPPALSIAATRRIRALLLGTKPVGIDIETLDRVARNASVDDRWLASAERRLLTGLAAAERLIEMACRWVLREAYGKASGRGLDLPLAALAFTIEADAVVLPEPVLRDDGWTFSLHRRGTLIIGVAAAGSGG